MNSSVSLPNWQVARLLAVGSSRNSLILKQCRMIVKRASMIKCQSARQCQYNRAEYSYKKVSVRWEIGVYNRVRSAAHRLRMSVSYLLHLILLEDFEDAPDSSYHRADYFTKEFGFIFVESIHLHEKPPPIIKELRPFLH